MLFHGYQWNRNNVYDMSRHIGVEAPYKCTSASSQSNANWDFDPVCTFPEATLSKRAPDYLWILFLDLAHLFTGVDLVSNRN
jgi:hypothetical protein